LEDIATRLPGTESQTEGWQHRVGISARRAILYATAFTRDQADKVISFLAETTLSQIFPDA